MSDPLLKLHDVSLNFGSQNILKNVNLEIYPEEILTLIGPNGAGKTSLVRIILGLLPCVGDRIQKKNLRIGYMPQKLELNQQLPLQVIRFLKLSHANSSEITQRAAQTGIEKILKHPMQHISGGELQRVLLCRALLTNPELLVLDEPAQGVDIQGQAEMYQLINAIKSEQKCGVLMVSHDLHWVMAQTDKVICLNHHVCCHGNPDQISNDPAFVELFGKDVSKNLAPYIHHHDHDHDLHGNVLHDHHGDHKC